MNQKFKIFAANIFRAVSVNIIRLMISVVLTLFLPRVMGVEEYSYWQLYQFYLTYVVYSSLGWCEGLYMKYAAQEYKDLNNREISGQFWALALHEVLFSTVVGSVMVFYISGQNKQIALTFAFISAILDILRFFLQSLLQTTNRIKDYSKIAITERLLFFGLVILALSMGLRDFQSFIYAELLARFLSLILAIAVCKKQVFTKPPSLKEIFSDSKAVVGLGYKLLLANLASQMIIGIVRFSIEQYWGTVTFGKVSLTLSLSNMVVSCIAAISIVLFPMLKQTDEKKLAGLYDVARTVTTIPILFLLVFYTPIIILLSMWLPQYADSLKYLAVLLPVCIYESRTFMLTNTYFKVYGQGGRILLVNAVTVALSILLSGIAVFVLASLDLAVVCIVILVAFKNIFAELLLQKKLCRNAWPNIIFEQVLTWVFIAVNWNLNGGMATIIYTVCFILYLVLQRKQLQSTAGMLKVLTMRDGK